MLGAMYLILIAWFYVTLMMAIAEATNPVGSVLGGIVTFVLPTPTGTIEAPATTGIDSAPVVPAEVRPANATAPAEQRP